MGMKFTIAGGKPMEKIELIALDLDGTALTPDNTVADATRAAVQRARAAGLRVVVSTGRICGEARDFALQLGADDLMVTAGGASLSSVSRAQCTMRMSMAVGAGGACGGRGRAHRRHRHDLCGRDAAHHAL